MLSMCRSVRSTFRTWLSFNRFLLAHATFQRLFVLSCSYWWGKTAGRSQRHPREAIARRNSQTPYKEEVTVMCGSRRYCIFLCSRVCFGSRCIYSQGDRVIEQSCHSSPCIWPRAKQVLSRSHGVHLQRVYIAKQPFHHSGNLSCTSPTRQVRYATLSSETENIRRLRKQRRAAVRLRSRDAAWNFEIKNWCFFSLNYAIAFPSRSFSPFFVWFTTVTHGLTWHYVIHAIKSLNRCHASDTDQICIEAHAIRVIFYHVTSSWVILFPVCEVVLLWRAALNRDRLSQNSRFCRFSQSHISVSAVSASSQRRGWCDDVCMTSS